MSRKYSLGLDIGSSSIKACLLAVDGASEVASATSPETELPISSPANGFAEQSPELWWKHVKIAIAKIRDIHPFKPDEVEAIGISYQMHGLVLLDKNKEALRDAIIWCDSRAVEIGEKAFSDLGEEFCLQNYLNSPGNFTASKLAWVKHKQPEIYSKIYKFMLPGDYIALRLTGELGTSRSGLSEGILWDFRKRSIASELLEYYGISDDLIPIVFESFEVSSCLSSSVAAEIGMDTKTKVSYRAGDQPNNAFSLRVLEPGQVATTAGTSAVIYGISDTATFDPQSRVNSFLHVNDTEDAQRLGVLVCINGAGIFNSWMRSLVSFSSPNAVDYGRLNEEAAKVSAGSDGLMFFPYGNGAERTLGNRSLGASIEGLHFNTHTPAHIFRATQEAVVFGMKYGLEIANKMGVKNNTVRAGRANMFLSPIFAQIFAAVTGSTIEFYNTDGAQGAARGAAVGAGALSLTECFEGLKKVGEVCADPILMDKYAGIYGSWKEGLERKIRG